MLTTVEKALALKKVDLFKKIPGEVLADIAYLLEEVRFNYGSFIVNEGEIGTELFIIIDGEVDILVDSKKIERLSSGQFFGEMSIIDSQPRSASVVAITDTILLKISKDDFFEVLKQRDEIAIGIIKVLCERIRNSDKQIANLTRAKTNTKTDK